MTIKKINSNGETIAIVLKKEDGELTEGINFLTEPENPLQACILNHPKGHIISPHIHHKVPRTIMETQEVLYVERGKLKVSFYVGNVEKIGEEILNAGDLIILMKQGHGMEMLEDCKIVYVKQGPYIDKETDKKVFDVVDVEVQENGN